MERFRQCCAARLLVVPFFRGLRVASGSADRIEAAVHPGWPTIFVGNGHGVDPLDRAVDIPNDPARHGAQITRGQGVGSREDRGI